MKTMEEKVKRVGEPFTLTVNKIEFYSFSGIAVPFYFLNDGRVIGGVRLDSFKKTNHRAILEKARHPRSVISSFLLGDSPAREYHQKVFEEIFDKPQSITLQEVSSPDWEVNKYEYLGGTAFFIEASFLESGEDKTRINLTYDTHFADDWSWAMLTLYVPNHLPKEANTLEDCVRLTLRAASRIGIIRLYQESVNQHIPFDIKKHNIFVELRTLPWWRYKALSKSEKDFTQERLARIFEQETGIKLNTV